MRHLAVKMDRESVASSQPGAAMQPSSSWRVYRFGLFEADEETGELRKQGHRLALQGQPLQVLLMLLARPGELVSRGDIQRQIWSDGTFVDFEHGLNAAINKIRDALGDSAANPRFIETLAKRGYRFIASVEIQNKARLSVGRQSSPAQGTPSAPLAAAPRGLLTTAAEVPRAPSALTRSLLLLLELMYLCFYVVSLARLKDAEAVIARAVPAHLWIVVLLIVTAAVGIPTRCYLLSGIAFNSPSLRLNFLRLFPIIFPFDELWALAPFLLADRIGFGLALGATAALLYAPFAQRSLILMFTPPETALQRAG
jgi:cholera toxin transcriptional activator